jgi:hypothetical protein
VLDGGRGHGMAGGEHRFITNELQPKTINAKAQRSQRAQRGGVWGFCSFVLELWRETKLADQLAWD